MNNYSENLFAAIDTIIAERLNKLNFDRTSIYTIISQYEKDKTKYWVTDGSIRFLATASEGTLYSQNQQVYVTIPQNNYEGDKVILGTYTSTDTTKNVQTYIDPYSCFVKSTPINIPKEGNIVTQIQATSDKTSTIISKTIPFTTHHPNQPYEYIGVTMAFDVNIKGYDGNYALIFEFQDSNNKTLHGTSTPNDLTDLDGNILVISSKQMHGNPFNLISNLIYNFVLPYPQEMKPEDIHHVNIILAQDGYFTNVGNIILTDLELAFGYNKDNLKANTSILEIGANETLKYADYDKVKTRTLHLDWVYQDAKTKEFSVFHQYNLPTDIFEEYTIYWLHYVDGAGENKDLSNEYNWVTLATNTNFSYQITLDTALKTDQYKAVVKYKLKTAAEEKEKEDTTVKKEEYLFTTASGIIFESTQLRAVPGAANASGDAIRFSFLDHCNGTFNYYGLDDRISETSRGSGPYTIVANFLDSTKWDIGDSNSRIEKVEWITPTANTMINTDKDIVISDNKKELSFYIKTIYLHEATNNRIECVVTFKNGAIRRGSINLQFGQNQTNGTTYAFNIDFVGSQNCLYLAEDAKPLSEIQVQASLTKSNGDPVPTPPITWSWVHLNKDGENDSHITITPVTNNIVTLSYNQTNFPEQLTLNDETQQANFSILQATIENYNAENGVSVDLKAYLPIPLAKKDYTHISGATRIVYDTLGNSISFSRNPYTLYKGNTEETNTVYWKCIAGPGTTEGIPEIRTMNVEEKLQHTLKPISYCPPEIPMACIAAYLQTGVTEQENEEGETIETPETDLVWLQPLLIVQNSWNSDMINDWDGSVEIDTEKGSIKSPMFMAGKKTNNNKFTGVVLGDVQRASVGDAVGLYGFQDSQLRYKLDENGAFYVGNGNDNFISFNEDIDGRSGENELIIKCQDFELETSTLSLNSKNSSLTIYNYDKTPRIRLGHIMEMTGEGWQDSDKNDYGLQIWDGAIQIYGPLTNGYINPILWFDPDEISLGIDGIIKRSWDVIGPNQNYANLWFGTQYDPIYLPNGIWSGEDINASYIPLGLQIQSGYLDEREGDTCIDCFFGTFIYGDEIGGAINQNQIGIYASNNSTGTYQGRTALSLTTNGHIDTIKNAQKHAIPIYLTITTQVNDHKDYVTWQVFETDAGETGCQCTGRSGYNSEYSFLTGFTADGQPQGVMRGTWKLNGDPLMVSSDQTKKYAIETYNAVYDIFFNNLQPMRYKYKHNTSDRYHTGFIAQEVEQALMASGLTNQDFAGFIRDENNECFLRYEEFISLNTWQIQKLKSRVAQLEQEIKELKNEI